MAQIKCRQTNEVFSVKVSINTEYQEIVNFYTKEHSLCKLINVLLDECNTNKPFKFKIKKRLEAIDKELKKSKEEI